MDKYSDFDLIGLSVEGDECAFEELVQRHYLQVYQFSFKWCRCKEDAEEITQEVFIKLTRKLKTFNHKSSFSTWLFRITINTAKDYSKKRSTRKLYESAFGDEQTIDNPESLNKDTGKADRMYSLIDELPEKQKAALMLVIAEGLSHGEAAKILKCREKTISWRIHQARNRLKAAFSKRV